MNNKNYRVALASSLGFIVLLVIISISLLMDAAEPKVALLYTTKEPIPDIAFRLASVPLSIASLLKFGSHQFALVPATEENLRKVLRQAEFVVVGTHGFDGLLVSDEKKAVGPPEDPNLHMRFIFFGSCYFGKKRTDWQMSFPNAKIIGQDGLAYQAASGFYLVFVAPIALLTL